jgi:hypothetical protein
MLATRAYPEVFQENYTDILIIFCFSNKRIVAGSGSITNQIRISFPKFTGFPDLGSGKLSLTAQNAEFIMVTVICLILGGPQGLTHN